MAEDMIRRSDDRGKKKFPQIDIYLPTVDNLYALSDLLCVPMDGLVCGSRENEFTFCYHPGYQRFLMYYKKCLELYLLNGYNFRVRNNRESFIVWLQ